MFIRKWRLIYCIFDVCLCWTLIVGLRVSVWSWTLNSRRINYSRWWRDCVPPRSLCSRLSRTLRRSSAPHPNASPKQRPRNTRAGNSGFCDEHHTHLGRITQLYLLHVLKMEFKDRMQRSTSISFTSAIPIRITQENIFRDGFAFGTFNMATRWALNLVWEHVSFIKKRCIFTNTYIIYIKYGICFQRKGIVISSCRRAWNDFTGSITNLALLHLVVLVWTALKVWKMRWMF